MRGGEVDLRDIVLQAIEEQEPGEVDLRCYENFEEVEPRNPYRILIQCPFCQTRLRLWVLANSAAIRVLEELLVTNIDLVCSRCAQQRNYNG